MYKLILLRSGDYFCEISIAVTNKSNGQNEIWTTLNKKSNWNWNSCIKFTLNDSRTHGQIRDAIFAVNTGIIGCVHPKIFKKLFSDVVKHITEKYPHFKCSLTLPTMMEGGGRGGQETGVDKEIFLRKGFWYLIITRMSSVV